MCYFSIWNQSVVPCPGLTVASWPAYSFLKRQVRWSGVPISFRIFQFIVIHKVKDLLELSTKKYFLFIIEDWNTKVGSQETPGVTGKFGLGIWNETGQRLIEFLQENTMVIADTLFQQHKRRLYTWTSPDGQHRNQIDYILCSQRWRSFIQSAKQDRELTVAQIMSSLLPNSDLNWRK